MPGQSDDLTSGNLAAWQTYATERLAADSVQRPLPDRLNWAQTPGVGPGAEILDPLAGRHLLELGCGTGDNAAYLAAQGATVTAIDGAAAQIHRARRRWRHPQLTFLHAPAHDYLTRPGPAFDLIISIFGALDWTPPDQLLPLITRRLRPTGLVAFSALHPDHARQIPSQLRCPSGRAIPIYRNALSASDWTGHLAHAGLTPTPDPPDRHPGHNAPTCLIITAHHQQVPRDDQSRPTPFRATDHGSAASAGLIG